MGGMYCCSTIYNCNAFNCNASLLPSTIYNSEIFCKYAFHPGAKLPQDFEQATLSTDILFAGKYVRLFWVGNDAWAPRIAGSLLEKRAIFVGLFCNRAVTSE